MEDAAESPCGRIPRLSSRIGFQTQEQGAFASDRIQVLEVDTENMQTQTDRGVEMN